MRGGSPAKAIACCAAQITVSSKSLSRAIAYLQSKNQGVRTIQKWGKFILGSIYLLKNIKKKKKEAQYNCLNSYTAYSSS